MDLTVIDKLMIVAHPDDESLWGGELLKEKVGSLSVLQMEITKCEERVPVRYGICQGRV